MYSIEVELPLTGCVSMIIYRYTFKFLKTYPALGTVEVSFLLVTWVHASLNVIKICLEVIQFREYCIILLYTSEGKANRGDIIA